jgi:hypothetical protein
MVSRCRYSDSASAAIAGGTNCATATSGVASNAAGRSCRRHCKNRRTRRSRPAARGGCRRRRIRSGICAAIRRRTLFTDVRLRLERRAELARRIAT